MNWEVFAIGFAAAVLLTLLGIVGYVLREAARSSEHRRQLEIMDRAAKQQETKPGGW